MLDLPSVAEASRADAWTGDEPPAVRPGRRARLPRPGRLDPGRPGDQGIRRRPRPGHPRPGRATASTSPPCSSWAPAPGPRIALVRAARGHALLCRPRLRHAARRQEPGPRRPPPPDPRQLRGRRRGPLRRRHPRQDPRPHPRALSLHDFPRRRDDDGVSGEGSGTGSEDTGLISIAPGCRLAVAVPMPFCSLSFRMKSGVAVTLKEPIFL